MHLFLRALQNNYTSLRLYVHALLPALLLTGKTKNFKEPAMSGGPSRGRGKGGRKGPPIVWEGSLGPDSFEEAVPEFPVESKTDFSQDSPLRGYDNRKEDWPKCMHGQDCLVQMLTDGMDAGRRFFRCPRAWVLLTTFPP